MKRNLLRSILATVVAALIVSQAARAEQSSPPAGRQFPPGAKYPHLPYPGWARREHIQGDGVLEFRCNATGEVTRAVMVKSTGNARLDQWTVDFVKTRWHGPTGRPLVHRTTFHFRLH